MLTTASIAERNAIEFASFLNYTQSSDNSHVLLEEANYDFHSTSQKARLLFTQHIDVSNLLTSEVKIQNDSIKLQARSYRERSVILEVLLENSLNNCVLSRIIVWDNNILR